MSATGCVGCGKCLGVWQATVWELANGRARAGGTHSLLHAERADLPPLPCERAWTRSVSVCGQSVCGLVCNQET